MVNIIKEELPIEESLRKKLKLICKFAKETLTIINRNIRKIDKTNLTYMETNRIIIKDKTFLIFNYFNEVFLSNISCFSMNLFENSSIVVLRLPIELNLSIHFIYL